MKALRLEVNRETSAATMPSITISVPPDAEKKDAMNLTGNIGWNPCQDLGDNRNHRRGEGPMQITLELPDDVAKGLESQVKNLPRALLESFALEGYRSGKLTEEQVRRILGYGTRMQVDGFLKEHGVYLDYNLEDVDRETETSREFSGR